MFLVLIAFKLNLIYSYPILYHPMFDAISLHYFLRSYILQHNKILPCLQREALKYNPVIVLEKSYL